ncbi:hypothetical protein ACK3TF_002152 [Chlorella vulgaris]
MIEEIDTDGYTKHYFDKVYSELGSNPRAFLEAALGYLSQNSVFFAQPGAADTLGELCRRHMTHDSHPSAAAAPEAPAPLQPPLPVAEPVMERKLRDEAQQQPLAAAAGTAQEKEEAPEQPAAVPDAAQAEGVEEEDEEEGEEKQEEESKGLKPNSGNGADLDTYSWTQSLQELVVSVGVPAGTKGRTCDVSISRDKLRVGLKGQPPLLEGPLFAPVVPDECLWNLVDGRVVELTLQKADGMQWWRSVVRGEPEIDVQKVEPEPSKLTDLEPEMRATVEKMMYDQRQKAMGQPTSEEQHKADMMQQFMRQHPEMDFSKAKIEM